MGLKAERKRESVLHRYYSVYLVLSRVGVLALFVIALLLVGFYRPSYNPVDVVAMLAFGMILGVIYVKSQDKLEEHYTIRLAEAGKKETDSKAA